mmetsp:Transcript_6018/g.21236  ORF Transcript_6018/g.21236 Transcript_6018/m.21236 type:complete len:234 (+) Transcript_6018:1176-1877(+)
MLSLFLLPPALPLLLLFYLRLQLRCVCCLVHPPAGLGVGRSHVLLQLLLRSPPLLELDWRVLAQVLHPEGSRSAEKVFLLLPPVQTERGQEVLGRSPGGREGIGKGLRRSIHGLPASPFSLLLLLCLLSLSILLHLHSQLLSVGSLGINSGDGSRLLPPPRIHGRKKRGSHLLPGGKIDTLLLQPPLHHQSSPGHWRIQHFSSLCMMVLKERTEGVLLVVSSLHGRQQQTLMP